MKDITISTEQVLTKVQEKNIKQMVNHELDRIINERIPYKIEVAAMALFEQLEPTIDELVNKEFQKATKKLEASITRNSKDMLKAIVRKIDYGEFR